MAKKQMKKDYYLLNQIGENTIFTLVGTYGKPFLRLSQGYADMETGKFFPAISNSEDPERCRLLEPATLAHKYEKSITWVEAWKQSIIELATRQP